MADIDRATWRYRAPIEVWWWAEQCTSAIAHRRADHVERRHPERDEDPYSSQPRLLDWALCFTYDRRKAAERRALRSIGLTP